MANNLVITNDTPIIYKGVDVSKHNGVIDWMKVDKNEVNFVIIRAGFGFKTVDVKFTQNIEGAIRAGLDIGIFWFSYAHNVDDAIVEAKSCLDIIEPYRQYITFPVWFDWEYDSDSYVRSHYKMVLNGNQVSEIAKAFMDTIAINGYKTGNYSNIDYLTRYFTNNIKTNYDLWLAHVLDTKGNPRYKSDYKGKYTIHQYSWVGCPSGFNGKVDMNYCYFDYTGKDTEKKKATAKRYKIPTDISFHTDVKKNVICTFDAKSKGSLYLSDHFQVYEFISRKSQNEFYSSKVKIHNKLIVILEALFKELNCGKIIVNSGYRTEEHDKAVGGSGNGYHTKGRAADVTCYTKRGKIISAETVCTTLEDMGGIYGIGYISPTSVHIDTRPYSDKWFGDETIKGAPSLTKLGYTTFREYFMYGKKK